MPMSATYSTEERMTLARVQMYLKFPFYAQLAMNLQIVRDDNVETAATDGENLLYNESFIEALSETELNFLVLHEVLHCALGHLWRVGDGRDPRLFNIAADYVINGMIIQTDPKSKFFAMPKGGLHDVRFYNMSTEEVYEYLAALPNIQKWLDSQNVRTLDNHSLWSKSRKQGTGSKLSAQWKERVIQATNAHAGKLPNNMRRLVQQLVEPKKNWRQLLAEFVQCEIIDYGFCPPDRRFSHTDLILPDWSEETEFIQNIVFAIDTSGSINEEQCNMFVHEVIGCLSQFKGRVKGKLIYCDDEIAPDGVYDIEDVAISKPVGGGGTNFTPVFKWIEKNMNNQCAGLVYLTDGCGLFPTKEPNYPVLWLLTEPSKVPFGRHCKF
jgi:predicted metal-dependent peptidase